MKKTAAALTIAILLTTPMFAQERETLPGRFGGGRLVRVIKKVIAKIVKPDEDLPSIPRP